MAENGLSTDHLVGRTSYIAWLGRPEDTPKGTKAYGEVKSFINKDAFDAYEAKGAKPDDTRQFPWRRETASASPANTKAMPAPPKRAGFPPPPRG